MLLKIKNPISRYTILSFLLNKNVKTNIDQEIATKLKNILEIKA